jgi:hypothetical protein
LTLEIGLNRMEYALINGENDSQLEESWRRTWWGMYTANGMMTAVNPGVQFRLKDVVTDVPLPCENTQYFSGVSTSHEFSMLSRCMIGRLHCVSETSPGV